MTAATLTSRAEFTDAVDALEPTMRPKVTKMLADASLMLKQGADPVAVARWMASRDDRFRRSYRGLYELLLKEFESELIR